MRYDQLLLKAAIGFTVTWLLVKAMDALIDGPGTRWYWRRVKGVRR